MSNPNSVPLPVTICLEINIAENGISMLDVTTNKIHVFNRRGTFINFFEDIWHTHVDKLFQDRP